MSLEIRRVKQHPSLSLESDNTVRKCKRNLVIIGKASVNVLDKRTH